MDIFTGDYLINYVKSHKLITFSKFYCISNADIAKIKIKRGYATVCLIISVYVVTASQWTVTEMYYAGQKGKTLQFFTVLENGWHSKKSLVSAGCQTKSFFSLSLYILKEGKRKQTNAGFIKRLFFMLGFCMFIVYKLLFKPPIKLTQ